MPDNLIVEPAPQVESVERDKLLAYYWRKGIPSLVLAAVTVLLAGYSYWFVQPNIQQRYRDICYRNFQLLGDDGADLQGASGESSVERDSQPAASVASSEERRRLLEQMHLCLRRLIIWDKSDDAVRFQSGRVSELLADWYLHRARAILLKELNGEEIGTLVGRSRNERQKATEAMRAVQKLNGPFADKAALWLANRQLVDNPELPTADLDAIAEQVAKIVDRVASTQTPDSLPLDPDTHSSKTFSTINATHLLRQIRVMQALSCRNEISIEKRLGLLQTADSLFESVASNSIESLGWAAEAKALVEVAAAQELANKTLLLFWASRDSASLSAESLAAVFRCLLAINSVKEGQIFLSEHLKELSPIDQPQFRALTAAAALRHVVSMALQRRDVVDAGAAGRVDAVMTLAVMSMAIQLNPESLELLALLEKFAKAGNKEPIVVWLKRDLSSVAAADSNRSVPPAVAAAAVDMAMKSFLSAVIGLGAGVVDKSTEDALVAAVKASPAYGVVASRLVMRLVSSESMSIADAIRLLRTINAAVPEVLVAWSDRASLHLKNMQFAEAIECYEFLIEKLPGNEQIGEALDVARKQSNNYTENSGNR